MAASPLRLSDLSPKLLLRPVETSRAKSLSLGITTLDEALPDGGLPSGAVVELCAPSGLGRATSLALSACAAAQRESRQLRGRVSEPVPRDGEAAAPSHPSTSPTWQSDASNWTAWVDPSDPSRGSLFAPALASAGVDLARLLVVRPDPEDVARISVRLATSRLFRVIVIDRSGLPGAAVTSRARWSTVVRRLALAAESSDTTILLLSSTSLAHREPLPTAMRIELSRPNRDHLEINVTKDRRGRLPGPVSVPMAALKRHAA